MIKHTSQDCRKNVYVPNDVRSRMSAYPCINWSKVAVRAFIEAMNEADVDALIRELQDSGQKQDN